MAVFSSDDDKLKSLVEGLNNYYDKTRTGKATGIDYSKATNLLRDHYDQGLVPAEMKMDIAKRLKYYAQNAGRSLTNDAPSVLNKIKSEGGFMSKLGGSGGFAKLMPILGLGAAGLGALGVMKKAHAGDYTGAGLDAAQMVDPTGISGMVGDIKKRMDDPTYAKEAAKEDKLKAVPVGMDLEQQAIDSTEDDDQSKKNPKNNGYKSLTQRLLGM